MRTHNLGNASNSNEKRVDITFTRTTQKPKLSNYKNRLEWSMDRYNSTNVTVVEDEEGVKLLLKDTRQAGILPYDGGFNYW